MLAQETIDLFPWIINASDRNCKDCREGKPCDKHNNWLVEYDNLVPTLIKAIQELLARIKNLEIKVKG